MKLLTLSLLAIFVSSAYAQLGVHRPVAIDFNGRIERTEVSRARLEKRLKVKTGRRSKMRAERKTKRAPSAVGLVLRPK